jgi:MFS transporter, ACS family, glucarate transporter
MPHDLEPTATPSRVRHFVVLVCMLMAVLLYLDRFCVSIAQPYIKQDLRLSTFQIGFFFSAFFLTYALFQVPSGWMTDRYGSRVMLVLYVLTWSLFTAAMGLAYGFLMLIVMRAAYGLGQAGAYPTSASVISKWVPFTNRGTASSIVAFGGRIGGAIAPLLTAVLIVAFVPTDRSSLVTTDDLLNPGELCATLAPPQNGGKDPRSDARRRVWSLLSANSQSLVREIANRHRPVAKQIAALEKEGKSFQQQRRFPSARKKFAAADELRLQLTESESTRLAAGLNDVLQRSDFYAAGDAAFQKDKMPLDVAGNKLRARVNAGESLSRDEQLRLNRLLLEATLGSSLGKVYVSGWRPVMITYGLAGLLVAGLIWVVLRDQPSQHPRCNDAERTLIAAGKPSNAPSTRDRAGRIPWGPLLRSGSMWANCISQVGTNIGWVFIVTWFPDYLDQVHHVKIVERGLMASIPLFVGWFGMLGGGRLTDYCVGKIGLKWGRRWPWGGSRFLAVAAFLACPLLDFSPWAVVVAMSVVAFATDLGSAAGWAFCQDVGGKNVGSVLGWGNMWGNLGATVSPILLGWVQDAYGYNVMFLVCAAAFVLAGVCGLAIDATVPIAVDESKV